VRAGFFFQKGKEHFSAGLCPPKSGRRRVCNTDVGKAEKLFSGEGFSALPPALCIQNWQKEKGVWGK